MRDIEEYKRKIECFTIQDLADFIRTEPLIAGRNSRLSYNKKQREELKNCMLEIAKKTLDLADLEEKFLLENMNIKNKTITIETDKELKELMKVCLDKRTYNVLKDLF